MSTPPPSGSTELLPRWLRTTIAYCVAGLVVGTVVAVAGWIALRLALVTVALLVALLLAALLGPLARWLHRGLPAWLAATLSVVLLLGGVGGTVYLLERRVRGQFDSLATSLTATVDGIRDWLVSGPLTLQPPQVDEVRGQVVGAVQTLAPSGVAAAGTVISALSGVLLALFVLFFLLKDGNQMWRSVVAVAPPRHRDRVAEAGRQAWDTLSRYVRGVVVIASVDAVLTGIGLVAVGVPLALSLTLLVFLGAFVPLLGATVSGAVAVLVTLVTRGPVPALIVLGVVLVVQNVEGNILQPFVQSRAVRLHPVVIVVAVTAGFLLFGVGGTVVAVPLVAVAHRVVGYLRHPGDGCGSPSRSSAGPSSTSSAPSSS